MKRPAVMSAQESTHCKKKEVSDTPTTSRSSRLKAFRQKEPECRKAPYTVIYTQVVERDRDTLTD